MQSACEILVSVLLPVYKGAATLKAAIDSVMSQHVHGGFELIVLDDGSPDDCWEIASQASKKAGGRMKLVRHANRGLAATLNRGLDIAGGTYIARLDQDDLMVCSRLQQQVDYLQAHPTCAMVGTWASIHRGGRLSGRVHRHPVSTEALRFLLLFDNPFVHSSMMMRADVLRKEGGYCEDRSRQPPEDYELWSRIAEAHDVANLPHELTIYCETQGGMSRDALSPLLPNVLKISSENIERVLGADHSPQQCAALARLYHGVREATPFSRDGLLTLAKIGNMLDLAASRIGGTSGQWPHELRMAHGAVLRHLRRRYLLARLPRRMSASISASLRWLMRHG